MKKVAQNTHSLSFSLILLLLNLKKKNAIDDEVKNKLFNVDIALF